MTYDFLLNFSHCVAALRVQMEFRKPASVFLEVRMLNWQEMFGFLVAAVDSHTEIACGLKILACHSESVDIN